MRRTGILLSLALVVAYVAGCMVGATAQQAPAPEQLVYPEGTRFPLGLYSIHTEEEMAEAGEAGWNIGHRYRFEASFLDVVQAAGWTALAHLTGKTREPLPGQQQPAVAPEVRQEAPTATATAANPEEAGDTGKGFEAEERAQTEQEAATVIGELAAHASVAWWDLPEEQRYWRSDEFELIQNLSAWTRKYDPRERPNFMYIPGHYSAEAIARYVPYLDIIGAGTYTEYAHQPRAWVRWRTEETIRGIELAGCEIGPDHRNGQKTPIGIPMLFYSRDHRFGAMGPNEAYHDFWSCIASGAKGILIFSYWHKRDLPLLQQTWELGFKRAAANLVSDGKLDQAILFGDDVPLRVEITKGSPNTPTFRPHGMEEDLSFPSVNVLAKRHEGSLYIIAVSSQERPVTARIIGLPTGIEQLEVMFEERPEEQGGNQVAVTESAFEDNFGWLGVHVYKAALP